MLEFQKLEKTFPGVRALKGIDFHINKGEIVGLVGENGAGKSTLMKVIYGAHKHDGGEYLINGEPVSFDSPRAAMDRGIGMVFQEQSLILNLSVMENIFLGFEAQFQKHGIINWKAMRAAARVQLAKVKLKIDPGQRTSELSFAERQLVELAKVLTLEERVDGNLVILLDEPTSVLAKEEVQLLFDLVRDLRERAAFIFVSHRMDEVLDISDRIYVLKDGEIVDEVNASEADVESIQSKMVGRDIDKAYYRESIQADYNHDAELVSFRNVSGRKYRHIDFTLHRGEVLAIVGTEGSGREAIMRTIFGLEFPLLGNVFIKGERVNGLPPARAVAMGVGYIPRERKIEGIVSGMSVYENMTLSQMGNYSRYGVLNSKRERALAKDWINALSIKAPSVETDCRNLSGGNQQKVVLSKWRSSGADIILLDHPTRGLDIGAKEDVYDMVRAMSADGVGVLLIADTLEEAIGLGHTILVVKDGEAQHSFPYQPGAKPALVDLLKYMI